MEELFENLPDVLTVEQMQEALCIGRSFAYQLIKSKEVKSIRLGKNYRIPKPYLIDYICKWKDGKPFSPDYASHHFKDILVKNNMPIIRFHDLRHSSASNLLKMGFSLKEIQEWLGHSSITITADTYAHLEFESKVKMADCLDKKMAMNI